jgi:mono/diheme cytochrome c family protein
MKRIFTIAALTIFVWGCAKKIAPQSSASSPSSNSGSAVTVPPAPPKFEAAAAANATPVASTAPAGPAPIPSVPATPAGTRTPAERTGTSSPEMLGQATYNTKCGRCHGLKVTADYTADRWISIMQVMATKAQLAEAEKENVLAYVKANAKK